MHHATQPEYIDKNYGGILIIWDRLFGTYQSEGETPLYGLTEQINSASPIDVHFAEARRFAAGLRRFKTWKTRIGYMLEGPEVRARD